MSLAEQPAPRVAMLGIEEAKAAAAAVGVPEIAAELSVFRVWLRHPKLAKWLSDIIMGLLWEGRLDPRLRELVIMRLGWATASDYEWTQHWRIALRLGVTADDMVGVRDWEHHEAFGPAERAILAATDETLAHGAVRPATFAACATHIDADPQVLLEVVAVIGVWRMVSGILRSLEVPLEDGVESWPPDGEEPS